MNDWNLHCLLEDGMDPYVKDYAKYFFDAATSSYFVGNGNVWYKCCFKRWPFFFNYHHSQNNSIIQHVYIYMLKSQKLKTMLLVNALI